MDPFTLIALAGLGLAALAFRKEEQARVAEVQAATEAEAVAEPPEPELSSILSGAAATALVTVGISFIAGKLAEREARESERASNAEKLGRIAGAIRQLTFKDLNGVPDADILAVFEGAVGVPACTSLAFTPGWLTGATLVAQALGETRVALNAPETVGGELPQTGLSAVSRLKSAPAVSYRAYYVLKGKTREGLGVSI